MYVNNEPLSATMKNRYCGSTTVELLIYFPRGEFNNANVARPEKRHPRALELRKRRLRISVEIRLEPGIFANRRGSLENKRREFRTSKLKRFLQVS